MNNAELTALYNEANGITDKNPPISTERIFKAMQAAYEAGRASRDAEVEALRADALRYRFLQNGAYVGIAPHPKPHEVWCLRLPNPKDAANLDQAIDAAMSAQEKENG